MHPCWHPWGGIGIAMMLLLLLFWVVVIGGIYELIRYLNRQLPLATPIHRPRAILDR